MIRLSLFVLALWFLPTIHSTTKAAGQQPQSQAAPPPPPGTERVLSFDRHGTRIAACAQKPGPPVKHGARSVPPTEIWITDGRDVWKTEMALGTCDPAWSPDGQRLAVTAPDGVWILSGQQQAKGERLIDAGRPAGQGGEPGSRAYAKPRWSPGGTRIAVLATDGGTSWVEVVDVATGKLVFRSPADVSDFSWGADSRSLTIGGQVVRIPQD